MGKWFEAILYRMNIFVIKLTNGRVLSIWIELEVRIFNGLDGVTWLKRKRHVA